MVRLSVKVDYWAVATTTLEISYILHLFRELHVLILTPLIIWCDNISAAYIAANRVFDRQTKHMELITTSFVNILLKVT